jgi:hypothetical protein
MRKALCLDLYAVFRWRALQPQAAVIMRLEQTHSRPRLAATAERMKKAPFSRVE